MRQMIIGLVALFAFSAFANTGSTLDTFNKHFKVVRDKETGAAVAIKAKRTTMRLNIKGWVDRIKKELKDEQEHMLQKGDAYQEEIDQLIAGLGLENAKNSDEADVNRTIRESLSNLVNIDVDLTFGEIEKSGLVNEFGRRLRNVLLNFDLAIISNLNDSRFFYRKRATYRVVTWALNWAKKRFSNIPILNTAAYIIVQVEKMVREQRTFYQNMLLHYLDSVDEEELGLTKEEVDHIFSSIYESRISWSNIMESNNAANNWDRYGLDKYYAQVRFGQNTLRNASVNYRSVRGKVNYAFAEVTGEKGRMIINLQNKKHMFSGKPAVAFYYDKPKKVLRERLLMNIAKIGVSFIPIGDSIKNLFNNFINSFYVEQKLTEGALTAYLDLNGNKEMANKIVVQNLNPFILF